MSGTPLKDRHEWLCQKHCILLAQYEQREKEIAELKRQIIQLTHGRPETLYTSTMIDWSGKYE